MNSEEFRKYAHETVDWIADYLENVEKYPVKSKAKPGEIISMLPETAPDEPEPFSRIMQDFNEIIMPGITHWESPNFFAYFPANNSFPSILGEMLTSGLGAQCMIWQTSPAAAELEERVMEWLRDLIGLPKDFSGVIQDTASTATLCSLLTAREKYSEYEINKSGFSENKFRVYCSEEAHSSIEKAVKIAGFGKNNLIKIASDENYAMKAEVLEQKIKDDIKSGLKPLAVVAAFGTTSSTAIDPLEEIAAICGKYNVWMHIDAAHAGTALLLPEMKYLAKGMELADSFVFNPHKWMFTNFDCSAYFVKDAQALLKTFEIMPEYLKTAEDKLVNNYRDWGVQLGRRFRALKLWFVLRSFGTEGIREKIRFHIELAKEFEAKIKESNDFEILAPAYFNTVCFRFSPEGMSEEELNRINEELLEKINADGKIYLTHTKLSGKYAIRMMIGQTNVERRHVERALEIILKEAVFENR